MSPAADGGGREPAHPANDAGSAAPGGVEGTVAATAEGTRGVGQLTQGSFDLTEAVGGVRGLLDSVAPGLVFVVTFVATQNLTWALIAAGGVALVAALARLLARGSLKYVFGGLIGVGIGTIWAWRTGQAQDFFVWGLYVNAAGVLIAGVSALARRPVVGLVTHSLTGLGDRWYTDPDALRRFIWATWLWAALFAIRLGVQVPLYLNAAVGWLGTARLVMGVPLWALVLYLTWLLVAPVVQRLKRDRT